MLYGKRDLDFKVEKELIYNGVDVLLISDFMESTAVTVYQVVKGGGVELNTLNKNEALELFNKYALKLLESAGVK